MATFRYEISPGPGGWKITCNGAAGPPYTTRDAAVLDTLAVTSRLRSDGHNASLRLFDHDGTGQLLETKDAKLFTR
jgi:hypothetical protein